MDDQQHQNEAADGRSDLTAVLATCAIGGVFVFPEGGMAACNQHGAGDNRCFDREPCEHKIEDASNGA